jgi:hypothetical protein
MRHPRFSVPEPLDSNFAYVSWPTVLLPTTNACNHGTLYRILHISILFQSFQVWSEELSGLSPPSGKRMSHAVGIEAIERQYQRRL